MKVDFSESFLKDLKAVRDKSILMKMKAVILATELSQSIDQISNLKKMRGAREYYRIRVGDFRIGLKLDGDTLVFIRFLNRKSQRNLPIFPLIFDARN